ncbi:MAG: hypothetical protein A2W52_00945 [Candidatus Taylorbacteria bacterium RIFCSPHIGHO2_02_49_25]|uniref:EamA domain-containing protein n=1 Tax=Candidatus Taylorbacteria bacterium RIFCSPHIGHO2_02_49_25 TaxID=1802305 RepID=A0A1G2MAL0_9BACT|nr:MAG: hypothetical protein UY62_C0017G0012 [Parcubacteria group bacterium GW2011_GWF2_50_9]OHA20006.1 MAG: hypothetical protein A2759_00220 [Candidatus Taylorbacteria bacterium RIFCSPHIGHO2_01_FULL_49_60]OHA20950.1 MAG: hypothetical protein A2W52_00945 [Candidatus Taylorbacteria bacterium RIFCSPHIGHO2_02_49_25]OHA37249.1 MAG: hypothetical protein A2W65_03190 [Candidatus Taylorbacteria bacterium RIFCSPLOWO2_02_50_13]OHA47980.1 MAG: hypothetical protein A3G61_00995 [Candidatus Taylorbacteria ba
MFGIFLLASGAFFSEVGVSLGKEEVARRKENIYTYGFLSLFLSTLAFFVIVLLRGKFLFSLESLPTLSLRIGLEILQAYVSIRAITTADRSTFGFLRVLTIPLLLLVDLALGYSLAINQIIGSGILTLSILFLFLNHGLRSKGIGLVLFSAVNAVILISLFKYDITYYNSVEVEQGIIQVILLIFFALMAWKTTERNPLQLLRNPRFLFQSLSQAIAGVLVSFGYLFVPASVAASVERSTAVFFSLVSGNRYFHEKKFAQKLLAFLLLALGFAFLAGLWS